MFGSNMQILTLNTNNTSPATNSSRSVTASTLKELNRNGNAGSVSVNGGGRCGSINTSSNHKLNKREQNQKHNSKTKFIHGNSSKMQQHVTTQQQQKYDHSISDSSNSNNNGSKLKKHYNNNNNNNSNNTVSTLSRKKYYQHHQQQQQQNYQQQQQQQHLRTMQQSFASSPPIKKYSNSKNNNRLVKNQNYTSIDLLMQQQQQQNNISNKSSDNLDHNTNTLVVCTCLLQSNCDNSSLTTSSSNSPSTASSLASTTDYQYHQQLSSTSYEHHLKPYGVGLKTSPLLGTPSKIIGATCINCWTNFAKLSQQSNSTNFKSSTSTNLQEFVAAATAVVNNSNQNTAKTTPTSSKSKTIVTSGAQLELTSSNGSLSSAMKKKSPWKNSNKSDGGVSDSIISSSGNLPGDSMQLSKVSNEKVHITDKNLITNTGDNNSGRTPLSKNNNTSCNIKKHSSAVSTVNVNHLQNQILRNQIPTLEKNAMTTSLTECESSLVGTSVSNNDISFTTKITSPKQKKCNSDTNTNRNSLGVTESRNSSISSMSTSTTTSVPSSPNSYSLDFLHSVGVKMTGTALKSSGTQSTTNAYDNHLPLNSPVHNNYSNGNTSTNHRQPRYVYGTNNNIGSSSSGGGHNHQQHYYHHQPTQLTIASFLQKDLLGEEVFSNVNNRSSNGIPVNGRNANNSDDSQQQQQQQQQRYTQQQSTTHNHYINYASPYQQQRQSWNVPHTNYIGGGPVAGSGYVGDVARLVTNGNNCTGNGGVDQRSYAYTNYRNLCNEGGVSKKNSVQQLRPRHIQNNIGNYGRSLNLQNKKSYDTSTGSSSSTSSPKSVASNTSSHQKPKSTANRESSNSSLNLAIETLPLKSSGVGNQRGNHRGHHNHHHNHQHHHHSIMNSPNIPQHQNYYNLTYVSTNGSVNNTTSRGCSPARQTLPRTPLTSANCHIVSLNTQQAPPPTRPPHNIICCSQLDEATTAAAAAAASYSSPSGIVAGNDYDSNNLSNHIQPNSSSGSTASLSFVGKQPQQQQNCSQPTTPSACGPTTPLQSPLSYNYYNFGGFGTHAFSNLQLTNGPQQLQQLPQHLYPHQPLPPPLPPHNILFSNPQTHHMRALSSSSVTSSVHDFFTHTPPDRFLARSHLVEVKETPSNLLNNSKWDNLSKGIWEKFMSSQQTEETFRRKMLLWRFLYIFIKNSYPRCGLYLVGSTISGFGSDSSDIDMCLVSRNASSIDPRIEALYNLTQLREHLNKSGAFQNFNLIEAKVPILRFRDCVHKLEVDLNFNNCVGIKNTHLLYCYSQLDWRLRPLVLVIKLWAQYHNINNAKNMTISSYSLVLMVIHFLQYAVNPPVLPCLHEIFPDKFPLLRSNDIGHVDMSEIIGPYESKNNQTIGELFLYFLEYYSCFNYTQYAISVRTGGLLPVNTCRVAKSLKNDIHQWKELCIEEPFDLTNTARSVYDYETFERVKAVFMTSWHILRETLELNSLFSPILPLSYLSCTIVGNVNTTTATMALTVSGIKPAFNDGPSDHTKDDTKQYVEKNCLVKEITIVANSENYKENNSNGDIIDVEEINNCDNNGTVVIKNVTQKLSKRRELNRNFTISSQIQSTSPNPSLCSLNCIKSSTKNRNNNNANVAVLPTMS